MYNPFSLRGKTILVTGASSGIGRATAIECSRLGATVILTGRNEERLAETLNLLDISENKHFSIAADLTQQASIAELVSNLPQLDGCVNNAGIGKTTPVQFISENDLEHIFHLNCFAPILLTKELVRKKNCIILQVWYSYYLLPGISIFCLGILFMGVRRRVYLHLLNMQLWSWLVKGFVATQSVRE